METKVIPMLRCVDVQVYVPWNVHEPYPEQYNWEGMADLESYLQLAQDMGLYVLLRPGPYICAEWDFGGFPWWLASSKVSYQAEGLLIDREEDPLHCNRGEQGADVQVYRQASCWLQVTGQKGLKLRSDDAQYLQLVDRWWAVLLPKIGRFLVERGGNILMVQV